MGLPSEVLGQPEVVTKSCRVQGLELRNPKPPMKTRVAQV